MDCYHARNPEPRPDRKLHRLGHESSLSDYLSDGHAKRQHRLWHHSLGRPPECSWQLPEAERKHKKYHLDHPRRTAGPELGQHFDWAECGVVFLLQDWRAMGESGQERARRPIGDQQDLQFLPSTKHCLQEIEEQDRLVVEDPLASVGSNSWSIQPNAFRPAQPAVADPREARQSLRCILAPGPLRYGDDREGCPQQCRSPPNERAVGAHERADSEA